MQLSEGGIMKRKVPISKPHCRKTPSNMRTATNGTAAALHAMCPSFGMHSVSKSCCRAHSAPLPFLQPAARPYMHLRLRPRNNAQKQHHAPTSRHVIKVLCAEKTSEADGHSQQPAGGNLLVKPKLLLLCAAVMLCGVANRVLYRMALVPMHDHVFFLAQFQNLSYFLVYFSILYFRMRAGIVTPDMLRIDKKRLWLIGACEAVAQLLFMISASHLPGALLPVLGQLFLVYNLIFASYFGARFSSSQLLGAALVLGGVMLAAAPSSLFGGGVSLNVDPMYVLICTSCFAFPALASNVKEQLFKAAREQLGRPLDIFVVNSFGSLFQAIFVLLLLPITASLNGITLPDLPAYIMKGLRCFNGLAPDCGSDVCAGAPLLPVAYVIANLAFNISILALLRTVGSVATSILGSLLVPLTVFVFTLPLPYLEQASLTTNFLGGTAVLLLGLVAYNWQHIKPAQAKESTS